MASENRIEVAVPCPLPNTFTYTAQLALQIKPGDWVEVPFGRRRVTGLVMALAIENPTASYEIKSVIGRAEHIPSIDKELLGLIRWAIRYYHAAPWDVISSMTPVRLLSREAATEKSWGLAQETELGDLSRAPKQKALAAWIADQGQVSDKQISAAGFSSALRRELQKRGMLNESSKEAALIAGIPRHKIQLNADQQQAADAVQSKENHTYLLIGPTGSGKTEVYLEIAQRSIDAGRQVLILVPEIGLTPQTEQRFRDALRARIGTYHSGMADAARRQIWLASKRGQVDLVVGTRSAVFLPFQELGLIVIDEEHDQSYKQQDGWRYHARQIAAVRARNLNISLLMGSATPSLDSMLNVERSRYQLLRLHRRHENRPMPEWQLSSPATQYQKSPLAPALLEQIEGCLKRGEQVLVFLNRRGFAPSYECQNCRWVATCNDCSCRLTAHRQRNALICHQCGIHQPIPRRCEQCQSSRLEMLGIGTERLELFLTRQFPDFPVLRLDRDSTKSRGSLQGLLDRINRGEAGILVGTQMLAKGHHFPAVTLAIILGVDQGLLSADPYALEQTAQLCIQVAGRAGRGDRPGQAVIETSLSAHPAITQLVDSGYEAFATSLLREREVHNQPPFSFWSILRVEHPDFSVCENALHKVVDHIRSSVEPTVHLLGPMPCMLERRGKRFRYQLQIHAPARSSMHQAVDLALSAIEPIAASTKVRWSIDIDPMGVD